jgi:hypothetical protein
MAMQYHQMLSNIFKVDCKMAEMQIAVEELQAWQYIVDEQMPRAGLILQ